MFPVLPGVSPSPAFQDLTDCLQIPGLLHAWYIIAKFPEPSYDYQTVPQDSENGGRVTYVIIREDGRRSYRGQQPPKPAGQPHGDMNYGTASNGTGSAAPSSSAPAQPNNNTAGEGSSDGAPPPSYAQVVAGDHKVQSQD